MRHEQYKENIVTGDKVDVLTFPAPHFRGFDGGDMDSNEFTWRNVVR